MGRDVMGWAKTISVISFFLLLTATIAWSSASEESEKYLDPAQFNEAVVAPGESISVNISSTSIIGQREYLVMRIVEDGSPMPDVRLILDSQDCEWIEPGFLHVDRQVAADSPQFRTVRVFIPEESGTYVLYNDAEEGNLWLVDDIKAQTMILESSPVTILVMVTGCCIGGPFGIIGMILALIGWRRNSVSAGVNMQAPLMTTDDIYKSLHREQSLEVEADLVPSPFTDVEEKQGFGKVAELEDHEEDGNWENWDNG